MVKISDSHYKSNIVGLDQTQTISNFLSISVPTVTCNIINATSIAFEDLTASSLVASKITATTIDADTITVNSLTATTVDIGTLTANSVTATNLIANSYLKLGAKKYIMFGEYSVEASIVALATSLTASPGSLYMGPNLWIMDASETATTIAIN